MTDENMHEAGNPATPSKAHVPPKPSQITPKIMKKAAAVKTAPIEVSATAAPGEEAYEQAATFGRVDEEGNVFVREGEAERLVGQYADSDKSQALDLYVRRYLDLKVSLELFAARLDQLSGPDIDTTLSHLREDLAEPAAVGDLAKLRTQLDELAAAADERKQQLAVKREEAKALALTERTKIVTEAESIAAIDPERMQWKAHGQRLRELLEEWKKAQRSSIRLDRQLEDGLWKRFAQARSTFDRARRQFFADLDQRHGEAKKIKQGLIERAEALSHSTDWGATTAAYRSLMDEWKAAGRASRKDDDALWERFRRAQDIFFDARNEKNAEIDAEYSQNLVVKEAILAEAEALLPVKDPQAAKAALRELQDRYEEAGKVPRGDIKRVEARMRAVEQAVRGAEAKEWERKNPRVRARAEGAAAQLEEAIAALQADLDTAKQAGDEKQIKKASEALDARKAWLEQVERAAQDAR